MVKQFDYTKPETFDLLETNLTALDQNFTLLNTGSLKELRSEVREKFFTEFMQNNVAECSLDHVLLKDGQTLWIE